MPTFARPYCPIGGLPVSSQGWRHSGWPLLPRWTLSRSFLLTAHMIQHLLIMLVAPPLILLGSPQNPLLRGLPRWAARDALGPFLTWRLLKRFGRAVTHPAFCWFAAAVALLGWHIPAAYDLALVSPGWHDLEHACLFGTSLLFWWPVVQPWPSTPRWHRWTIPAYLLVRRHSHHRSRGSSLLFRSACSTPRMPRYPGSLACPNSAIRSRRAPSCGFSVPSFCSAPR